MTLDSSICRCGHALAVHDPCSTCQCPKYRSGKARKFPVRKADQ